MTSFGPIFVTGLQGLYIRDLLFWGNQSRSLWRSWYTLKPVNVWTILGWVWKNPPKEGPFTPFKTMVIKGFQARIWYNHSITCCIHGKSQRYHAIVFTSCNVQTSPTLQTSKKPWLIYSSYNFCLPPTHFQSRKSVGERIRTLKNKTACLDLLGPTQTESTILISKANRDTLPLERLYSSRPKHQHEPSRSLPGSANNPISHTLWASSYLVSS